MEHAKRRRRVGVCLLAGLLLAALGTLSPLGAQTYATVTGVVQDSTQAVIPDAQLTLTNVDQNRSWTTRSNQVGAYTFQQIPPGNYTLEVQAEGFKKFTRSGLVLRVAQVAEINVTLELGTVTEVVEVTAETPLLETASSTLGEVINDITTENLPLNGRNIIRLVLLVPGINPLRQARTSTNGMSIGAVNFSANGGRNVSNLIMVDGSPQEVMGYKQPAYIPTPDAVQEFKVQTNALSAQYGRTGGAVVNIVHRSGTSEFHGVVYEFLRNDIFDANNFFQNRQGKEKAGFRYNQFGFTLGGPLTPSRETTFFFVNYEGLRIRQAGSSFYTVPTEKMKQGDFSEIADIIYDPLTINDKGIRQPFPNQMIPKDRHHPVALNFLANYPTPNVPGALTNNFFSTKGGQTRADNFSVKVDRRISERQNLFGRFSWHTRNSPRPDEFGTPGSINLGWSGQRNRSVTLDDTYMIGGWVLHGNYGYGYFANPRETPRMPGISSKLGLPDYVDAVTQFDIFPLVTPAGYTQLGANAWWIIGNKFETHTWQGDASKLIGNHSIKFGGVYRLDRVSNFRAVNPGGRYSFNENWTRKIYNKGKGGDSIASMLLGLPSGGNMREEPALSEQVVYGALYLQDDWRVNSKLTLNLGVRWDADWPLTERYDRASSWCAECKLPLEAPGFGPFYGGIRFAGKRSDPPAPRGIKDLDWANFSPRIGLAYKVTNKMVIRTGFGIFYNPTTGHGPNPTQAGALSFNAITNLQASIDGGRTPYATLSDPYPDGFNRPRNGADGLMTFVGQSISANWRDDVMPYSAQWNFNIQYELPGDMMIDAAYAGNAGVNLMAPGTQHNQLRDELMSLGDELSKKVDNPFYGILPATTPMGKKTTTYGQLLRPYPHLTGLNQMFGTMAHSSYHSFQFKFRKRYSHGLQMLAAYTWAKLIDDISMISGRWLGNENPSWTNNNQRWWNKSISGIDVAHRIAFNFQYELPFGLGKPLLSQGGWVNQVAGGWVVNGIISAQSGLPLEVQSRKNNLNNFGGIQRPNRTGEPACSSGSRYERINGWFNEAAFEDPPPFTYGNTGRFLPDCRGPGYYIWDLSVLKNFPISERFRLQFRAEFFNALNRANFRDPVGSARLFGRPNFGVINQTFPARVVQLGLKLYY